MERSVLVEENHQRSDSTPISQSSGSIIRIDAIFVELTGAMENKCEASNCEASKCEHFSIRGYAAEMRKKDMSLCSPFPFVGNQNKLEEREYMLPPLDVAKFRWWRCQNCLREIDATSVAEETEIVCNHFRNGVISAGTCPHPVPSGSTAVVLSGLQISSDPGHLAGRKTDGSNSDNIDGIRLSSCYYNKEKRHEVGCAAVVGQGNGANSDVNPMLDLTSSNPCSIQERHANGPNDFVSKARGLVELCAPNYRSHASADHKNPESMPRKSSEMCLMRTLPSCDSEQRIASMAPHGMNFSKGQTGKHPSLNLEENDEILAETGHRDQHMDSPNLSTRQRTQKVRLLAELLGSKRNSEKDRNRTEGDPSCGIPTTSSGLDTVSALSDHLAIQGSIRKHFEDPKGKRKMFLDEGKSTLDLICPRKLTKKARVFKEGSEITSKRIEGNPTQSEKKNKKIPLDGKYSPSMPKGGIVRKINQVKVGGLQKCSAASDGGVSQSVHYTSMTKSRIKPYFRSSLSPHEPEGNGTLCKKKSKQVGAGKTSVEPKRTSLLGESSIMTKYLGIKENKPSAQVSIGGKGPDLSLNSFVVAHRNEKGGIGKGGDGSDLIMPLMKDTRRGDTQQRNAILHIGEPSASHKSAPDQFFRKGLLCDLNENIAANRMSPLREMQNLGPWVENGSFSRHQHLDFSGKRTEEVNEQGNDDIPMDIVELLARKQYERYCHEAERIFLSSKNTKDKRNTEQMGLARVQGNDDIPMDIVELLARKQYERCCHEAERIFLSSKHTKDKGNTEQMGLARVHGNAMLTSLAEDKRCVVNPVSGMGIVRTSENVGSNKRNLRNCFSETCGNNLNFGQPEGNSTFAGFSAFSKYKEKQTGGIQISDSLRTRNPQSCNWKGSPNESLQREEARPNHITFGFNIHQMHAPQSCNFEFRPQFPKLLREGKRINGDHDLNFMKPSANDLGKHKRNSHPESIRRETAEHPFANNKHRGFDLNEKVPGSLDLNSNETIPAMQLLSLMDAGVQSTSAFSLDGSPKFFTKPFFPCPNHPKVLEKPLFAYDQHSNRGSGAYNDIPRNPSSAFYGRNVAVKSCECPPAVPAFVSPFRTEGSSKRGAGFTKSEERGKALMQSRGPKSQKSGSTSGVSRTSSQYNLVQNKQNGVIYPSNANFLDLEACYNMTGTVLPMSGISKDGICTLNRNPADFSIPEARNVYMISGKDIKFGKKGYSRGRSGLNTGDGRKRQRVAKLK